MLGRILSAGGRLLLATAIFLVTLEATLAFLPGLFPDRWANYAFSKYGSFPGGIYFYDAESNVNFQRPVLDTEMFFNGYRWLHSTDQHGFRDPGPPEDRPIWLLGDSLIYGHGVDDADTLAHILRADYDLPAYNMARQGDSLYQHYVLTRLHLDSLTPQQVVLFVFLNDFQDLTIYRTNRQMQERAEARWNYSAMQARLADLEDRGGLQSNLLLGLPSIRLLRGVISEMMPLSFIASAEASTASAPNPPHADPPYLDAILDPAVFANVAGYYDATLADLRDRLAAAGVELLVVDLAIGVDLGQRGDKAQARLSGYLASACSRLDLTCASTAGLFDDCPECFLPNDGHLSPTGQRLLGDWLGTRLVAER